MNKTGRKKYVNGVYCPLCGLNLVDMGKGLRACYECGVVTK